MSALTDSTQQPAPIPTDGASMHDLVIGDMVERKAFGFEKYGVLLTAHNGRPCLIDAYQEVLDLAVYLRQAIVEAAAPQGVTSSHVEWGVCANLAGLEGGVGPLLERDSEEQARAAIGDWFRDGHLVTRTVTITRTPWTEVPA